MRKSIVLILLSILIACNKTIPSNIQIQNESNVISSKQETIKKEPSNPLPENLLGSWPMYQDSPNIIYEFYKNCEFKEIRWGWKSRLSATTNKRK